MKKLFKKGISGLLAVLMCLTAVVSIGAVPAYAAEEGSQTYSVSFPRDGDVNVGANWGRPEMHLMSGWHMGESTTVNIHTVGSFEGIAAYCIEPGVARPLEKAVTSKDESYWDNYPDGYNDTIDPSTIKLLLGRIMQYGYQGNFTTAWRSQNAADADKLAHIMATQALVWETVVGERDENFNHVLAAGCDAVKDYVSTDNPLYDRYISYYDSIEQSVQGHTVIPSFMAKSESKAQSIELEWNGSAYTATLTDTNNVISKFDVSSSDSHLNFSVSGNKLTITATEAPTDTVTVSASKENTRAGVIVWSDGNYGIDGVVQDVVTYSATVSDPVSAYLKLKVSYGSCKIVKTSEDNVVSGISFTISGNGVNQTVKTGSDGSVTVDNLAPGTYTVTEAKSEKYVDQESRSVTVVSGKVATVTFNNTLKRGDLKVTKTSEDGLVEGVKFHLYGTSLSGAAVDEYAVTGKDGVAIFEKVLVGSNYTLEEVDTPNRYVVPDKQMAAVEWNKVTSVKMENKLKRGELQVTKTSEDGLVKGITFHLYGTSFSGAKVDEYADTDKNGTATFKNILIGSGYTVEEVNTVEKYIVPANQTAGIEWSKVTKLSFENVLKRGSLKVTKTSEDGLVEGVKFHLYGTSLSGIAVDEFVTTNNKGIAIFENILIGTGYTVEEVDTAARYVIPENQAAAIEWNKVTKVSFENILKKFNVTLTKTDKENETPQGDGTLAGAVYGLYKGDELIASYTTNESGSFTTDYYPCGNDWSIKEITPSEGYLLDTGIHKLGVAAKNYTIELNPASLAVTEQILKGSIAIIKHCDNGETKLETPETGAVFEVYLKSAGSFKNANESEKDTLTCDSNGFAQTKELPYGVYTVHQVFGWDGRELMPDFDVYVCADGQIYRYLINNAVFESYIKVVKIDSETGKTIPYAGAGFRIYTPAGKQVTMTYTYPEITVIDTFYTASDGTLITPEKLEYGKGYSLVEVQAPYGYVLDPTPMAFDITADRSTAENDITLVVVEKTNAPQKGRITISKTGEVFASVTEKDGTYTPVYEMQGLEGATFEIRAAEDIVTPDGTVRVKAGELVDTMTTCKDGTAISKELYLGKYVLSETQAPYGFVLNREACEVELVYAGQEVILTDISVPAVNQRQKAEINLKKAIEKDSLFELGENREILTVRFGLYAAEELIAKDGSKIPANGLLEAVSCDESGNAVFSVDIPVGAKLYVKEIVTDEHYVISEDAFPVEFKYGDSKLETVMIKVNNGKDIENELLRGTVQGVKVDEDKKPVQGALFGLFKADETTFTTETAYLTCVTNAEGIFAFDNLPFGSYAVREISPAEGFVLNETVYSVEVRENGQLIEIGFENLHITGAAQVTKIDEDYPENKLTGATFEIYLDVDGNNEFNSETDMLLGEMTEAETGIYRMENLRYGGYFLYEKEAPEGFLKDDGYYFFEIRENGSTVEVENKAGVGFINQARTGNLRIEKTSEDGVLKDFTFKVEGKDLAGNSFSKEYVTDDGGLISIEGLRIGDYTVSEVSNEANTKYTLPADKTVTVLEEKTTVAKFYNELKPLNPDIPKTGDESHVVLWLSLMGVCLAGVGVLVVTTVRRKKKED